MIIKSMSDFGSYYVICMMTDDSKPIMDPYMKVDKKSGEMSGFNPKMVSDFFDKYDKNLVPKPYVRVLNNKLKKAKAI